MKEIGCGDIGAVVGLKFTTTGDTLCAIGSSIILDSMDFPKPVIGIAIEAKPRLMKKLAESLQKLAIEDPSLQYRQTKIQVKRLFQEWGVTPEIIIDRLLNDFKASANVGKPQVAYKETISITKEAEGKFDQHTGAKGQYGHVILQVEPLPRVKVLFLSVRSVRIRFLGSI